jgi:tetratricopeptide (TPR) repeat protein
MKKTIATKKPLSRSKTLIFKSLLVIVPVLFFVIVELCLRLVNYGHDYSLFISHPDPAFQNYKIVNPEIGAKYFQKLEYTKPQNDLFLKKKDENSFRIFVLGSSSVVGFPYDANLMFPRILQNRLQAAYPDKKIEVVNTAITAINSYTLLDFTDDVLAEKPDAILIYAGHNEYYGAFGVGSNEGIGNYRPMVLLHLKLMDLRFYQLLRNVIFKAFGSSADAGNEAKRGTLMSKTVKKADIAYQGKDYKIGLEQYKANMSAILEKAVQKKVPVFYSTMVSNISDMKPFGSVKPGTGESAEEYFLKGQAAESKGDFKLAKELYTKARDLDCVRFRASSDINVVIEDLAGKYNVHLVPMFEAFETKSPNSLVGNNLITEHVHPNISGYFLMADVFYNAIAESKLIASAPNPYTVRSADDFKNSYGYTALDSLLGYHRITNLSYHWPFRDESKIYIDYRLIYKPVGQIDSLAFNIMAKRKIASLDAHLLLADEYVKQGDLIKASREYNAMIQIAPNTPELLTEAGIFFIKTGDLPLALSCFTKSSGLTPSFSAFFRAGEIYMLMNDYSNASRLFTRAFEMADANLRIKTLVKLYTTYTLQGKKADAEKVLQAIHQIQPKGNVSVSPKSYLFGNYIPVQIRDMVMKANELRKDKKSQEALSWLIKSLEINDSPIVSRMIAEVYSELKGYRNSAFYVQKAYPWFKFEPAFLVQAINIHVSNGTLAEAKECLVQLKAIDPENPQISALEKML